MAGEQVLPKGAGNDWANHPGFAAVDDAGASRCEHQHTVDPGYRSVATSRGFGCLLTGGHCLPGTRKECCK